MNMRRFFLLTIVLLLALVPLTASAGPTITKQVPIYSATDDMGPVFTVLDDNTATFWSAVAGSTLTLKSEGSTVREIWVRNGAYTSKDDYYSFARPHVLKVTLTYNNSSQQVSYRYRMADAYSDNAYSNHWCFGYQRILLPGAVHNVSNVILYVESVVPGTSTSTAAISDIILSSGQADVTATAKPTEKPAPQPTEVPVYTPEKGITCTLTGRMATRTGPGNEYDEPGSFFQAGAQVQAFSKVYDHENELYWVQVEWVYSGEKMRGYTTSTRLDINVHLLPDDADPVDARIVNRTPNYYGPGADYRAHTDTIYEGQHGRIYAWVNGYAFFEWHDDYQNLERRAWIPMENVTW